MPKLIIASLVIFLLGLAGCSTSAPGPQIEPARLRAFKPLPAVMESSANPVTEEKVRLGRMLYFDPRLSRNQDVSCNSCHDLQSYGVDHQRFSTGFQGQKGGRNAPTVFNAAGHLAQFWDGRAKDVEEQAKGPVMNPVEMAMQSEKIVIAVLKSMPEYVAAFQAAFPGEADPVTFDNMGTAIGAFERKLVTPSRWDQFLAGDASALKAGEKEGFLRFSDVGCANCHMGTYLGGSIYQKVGVMEPFPDTSDKGRMAVTKSPGDEFVFKVPSLRNIEKTGPYFHDGSATTLEDAVRVMAECQLGKDLTDRDVQLIVTWLKSLTGEIPADYVKKPELPKSTSQTPKPSKV